MPYIASDACAGTGDLDAHLSDQGFSWIPHALLGTANSLELDSGITGTSDVPPGTNLRHYYLDDPNYGTTPGVFNPNVTSIQLATAVDPTKPGIHFDLAIWNDPSNGATFNGIQLAVTYIQNVNPLLSGWAWAATTFVNGIPGENFGGGAGSIGAPSELKIDTRTPTQTFYIDGVLMATLAVAYVFDDTARPDVNQYNHVKATAHGEITSFYSEIIISGPPVLSAQSGSGETLWTQNESIGGVAGSGETFCDQTWTVQPAFIGEVIPFVE